MVVTGDPGRYEYLGRRGFGHVRCDTQDFGSTLEVCRGLAELCGVSSSSEYFIPLAAAVAAELELPASDVEALNRCRHKDRQRAVLWEAGVEVPLFGVAETAEAACRWARHIGLPVVVKPTTGSGSSGVRLCHTMANVAEWSASLLAIRQNERGQPIPRLVLVEQYVEGPEFSVETFDGEAVTVVAKHLGPQPHFVEIGHDVPAPDGGAVADLAERAVAALGLTWGPTHTELRLSAGGPVVIEVNPRLAGGMIPELVRLSCGVDLIDWTVARGCGQPLSPRAARAGQASIRFLTARTEGTVDSVSGLDAARRAAHVARVTVRPGTPIRLTHSFRDRVGYVITTGPDSARAADRALARIELRIQP